PAEQGSAFGCGSAALWGRMLSRMLSCGRMAFGQPTKSALIFKGVKPSDAQQRFSWPFHSSPDARLHVDPATLLRTLQHLLHDLQSAQSVDELSILHRSAAILHRAIEPPHGLLLRVVIAFAVSARQVGV